MKKLLTGAIAVTLVLLAGCSADSTDFKKAAEKTIVDELNKTTPGAKATCSSPSSTKIGTTFDCTATTGDGTTIPVLATITGAKEVTVGPATGDATGTDTSTVDTTPTSVTS